MCLLLRRNIDPVTQIKEGIGITNYGMMVSRWLSIYFRNVIHTETHAQNHVVMSEKRESRGDWLELIMLSREWNLLGKEHSQHQDRLADPWSRLGWNCYRQCQVDVQSMIVHRNWRSDWEAVDMVSSRILDSCRSMRLEHDHISDPRYHGELGRMWTYHGYQWKTINANLLTRYQ